MLSIRRKAYKVDNPVQAKAQLGVERPLSFPQLRVGVELLYRSSGKRGVSPYPELRFACTGLFTFKTFGLI